MSDIGIEFFQIFSELGMKDYKNRLTPKETTLNKELINNYFIFYAFPKNFLTTIYTGTSTFKFY